MIQLEETYHGLEVVFRSPMQVPLVKSLLYGVQHIQSLAVLQECRRFGDLTDLWFSRPVLRLSRIVRKGSEGSSSIRRNRVTRVTVEIFGHYSMYWRSFWSLSIASEMVLSSLQKQMRTHLEAMG